MTRVERIAREARENSKLAKAAAAQLRACQVRGGQLAALMADELDRIDRKRVARK